MDRRHFLARTAQALGMGATFSATALWSSWTHAHDMKTFGQAQPFSLDTLKAQAKQLAHTPYQAPAHNLPPEVANLGWEAYHSLQHQDAYALWADERAPVTAKFFHLGLLFKSPVKMYQVIDGAAQELAYDPNIFDYSHSGLNPSVLPEDLGYAGFKVFDPTDLSRDVAAFLGASYFRAVGADKQYGLSARGLAVDTAMPNGEEFPEFVAFWLEKPKGNDQKLTVYALLDSPSVCGAYQFDIHLGDTLTMQVCANLYPRQAIARLGIAPCTSMYQYGENDRRMAWDWRPEIHDSDGLQIHTGQNEWIWRPLTNPEHLRFNAFQDNNPKGFGLLQRDRDADHYQDDGVFYERRPCLWVEPLSGWGKGAINLVEIPTIDETFDNIVACWTPETPPQQGDELTYTYKLYWGANAPAQPPLATCVETYTGLGGQVGKKRTAYSLRFVADFVGQALQNIAHDAPVEAIVSVSHGTTDLVSARPIQEKNGYRAMFDLYPGDFTDQIEIRLYLHSEGQALTETWLYHWTPPALQNRPLY